MAKKFGKFLLLSAAVTTAAAAAYYFLQKKESTASVPAEEDEDLDDFSDDLDEDTDIIRNYVRLTPESKDTKAAADCSSRTTATDCAAQPTDCKATETDCKAQNATASCDVKEDTEDALYSESQTTAEISEEAPETVVEFFNEDSAESQDEENK